MDETIVLSIDRLENGVAVCFDDEGKEYHLDALALPSACDGAVFLASVGDGGALSFIRFLPEEQEKRRRDAERQLHRLFSRTKNKNN